MALAKNNMKTIFVTYAVKEEYIELNADGYNIIHIQTGVGKTKSAFFLTKNILEQKPDLVLNIGTAGTITHSIGDILVATHFTDRDYEAIKLPGIEYEIEGTRLIENNPEIKEWIAAYSKTGICSTGDTFVTEISSFSGDFVDMEAYAQAYVCQQLGVPFVSVKYITDIIGKNSVEHWENKLSDARTALSKWVKGQNLFSTIL